MDHPASRTSAGHDDLCVSTHLPLCPSHMARRDGPRGLSGLGVVAQQRRRRQRDERRRVKRRRRRVAQRADDHRVGGAGGAGGVGGWVEPDAQPQPTAHAAEGASERVPAREVGDPCA